MTAPAAKSTAGSTASSAPPRLSRSTWKSDSRIAPIRIVHIGLGAFHRAHQAWYTDLVDTDREWGIAAFTGRRAETADELSPQDGLFTVIERSAHRDEARVVESVVEATPGTDIERLVELIAAQTTAIVTITITEAGYRLLPDGRAAVDDIAVQDDIQALRGGAIGSRPTTTLCRILLGLAARRHDGAGPLAIVPCDNVPGNGPWLRRGLVGLAEQIDDGLARWIDENVSFVSTSVDRITPTRMPGDLSTAEALIGFSDAAAVVTEPFHDWIISGEFPAGRPAWENAGARFVDDIDPFERRKLWLLNGSHTLLAYAARLTGHDTVSDAVADPDARAAVNAFWDEASRHLPVALDLDEYRSALLDRFDNARIVHTLAQIGRDGLTKLRLRIVPVLLAERADGRDGAASIRAIAAWITLTLRGADLPDAAGASIAHALVDADPVAVLLDLLDGRLVADEALLTDIRAATRDLGAAATGPDTDIPPITPGEDRT